MLVAATATVIMLSVTAVRTYRRRQVHKTPIQASQKNELEVLVI